MWGWAGGRKRRLVAGALLCDLKTNIESQATDTPKRTFDNFEEKKKDDNYF